MIEWDERSEQVSKIRPDREKAKSLLKIISLREKSISNMKACEFTTLIVEGYYEITKELITALMSIDGWKTLSHEMLIGYLAEFYTEFSRAELNTIDQLRKTRNDIAYRGLIVNDSYLERNKESVLKIINKLKHIIKRKLGPVA